MKSRNRLLRPIPLLLATVLCQGASFGALAAPPLLIKADTLFDGTEFLDSTGSGWAVLVQDGKIAQVGPANQINAEGARIVNVPGGTILPGFIDMHTHHLINGVPPRRMLEHGVTTARDLGWRNR